MLLAFRNRIGTELKKTATRFLAAQPGEFRIVHRCVPNSASSALFPAQSALSSALAYLKPMDDT